MLNIPAAEGQQEHVSDKAQKQKNHGDTELLAHVFGSAIRPWMANFLVGYSVGRGVGFFILDFDHSIRADGAVVVVPMAAKLAGKPLPYSEL